MAKITISRKQKESTPTIRKLNLSKYREYKPSEELLDIDKIGAGIMECFLNNDPEGVMEIIAIYLESANRAQIAKKSRLARSTLYHSLKNKNPTIKTLAKLIHASKSKFKKAS